MGKLIALHVLQCEMLGKRASLLKLKKSPAKIRGLSRNDSGLFVFGINGLT
jgi:hypothetical protein